MNNVQNNGFNNVQNNEDDFEDSDCPIEYTPMVDAVALKDCTDRFGATGLEKFVIKHGFDLENFKKKRALEQKELAVEQTFLATEEMVTFLKNNVVPCPVCDRRITQINVDYHFRKIVKRIEALKLNQQQQPKAPVQIAPVKQPEKPALPKEPEKKQVPVAAQTLSSEEAHEKRVAEQLMIEQQIASARKARSPSPLADLIKDPEIRNHLSGMLCERDHVFHMEIWRCIAANAYVHKKAQLFAENQSKYDVADEFKIDLFIAWCDENKITIEDIKSAAKPTMFGQTERLDRLIQNYKMAPVTAPHEKNVPAQDQFSDLVKIQDNLDITGFLARWLGESNTLTSGLKAWEYIAKQVLNSNYFKNKFITNDGSLLIENFIRECSPAKYGLTLNNLIQRLRNLGLENCADGLELRLRQDGITPGTAPGTAPGTTSVATSVTAPQEVRVPVRQQVQWVGTPPSALFDPDPKQKPIAPVAPPMQPVRPPVQQTTQLPERHSPAAIETYISKLDTLSFYNPILNLGFEASCLLEELLLEQSRAGNKPIWEAYCENTGRIPKEFKKNGQFFMRRFFRQKETIQFAEFFTYLDVIEGRGAEVRAIKNAIKMPGTPAKNRTGRFPLNPLYEGVIAPMGSNKAMLRLWDVLQMPSRAKMTSPNYEPLPMQIYEAVAGALPDFSVYEVLDPFTRQFAPGKFFGYIWDNYARTQGRQSNLHITYTLDDLLEHFMIEDKADDVKRILIDIRDLLQINGAEYDQKHLQAIINTLNSPEFN